MKFFVSSVLTVLAVMLSLALPACSGASSGLGGSGNCASASCGNGQTLQTCVPQSGCGNTTYSVNGQTFTCDSCTSQDCVQAAQQAANVCLGSGSSSGGGSGSGSGSGGGTTTCSAATQCGTGTRTYQECTTVSSLTGACTGIGYKTSDGMGFSCAGCTNCNDAAKKLSDYCSGITPDDGGTGVTSCSAAQACGTTGLTFQECTTVSTSTGMCSGIAYNVSNGTSFDCASCGDCSAAVSSLDTFCQGGGTPTTTCGSASACGSNGYTYDLCTTSLNGVCQSMYYSTTSGQTYQCAACGDCTAAGTSVGSYCASMSQTTSCGTASACGNTGVTYDLCTTSTGSCTSEYYSTSDGQQYTCNSCSDCSAAVTSLNSYCASLNTLACGTTTCTTGNLCCTCTGVQQCLSSNGGTYTCASYGCQ